MSVNKNFTLPRGTTWSTTFVYGFPAKSTDVGAVVIPNDPKGRYYIPVDISSWTPKLEVVDEPGGTVEDTLTVGAGLTFTGAQGLIAVSDLADWTPDVVQYGLIISLGSVVTEIGRGSIYLEPQIVT